MTEHSPSAVLKAARAHLKGRFLADFKREHVSLLALSGRNRKKAYREAGLSKAYYTPATYALAKPIDERLRAEHGQRLFELYARLVKEQFDASEPTE